MQDVTFHDRLPYYMQTMFMKRIFSLLFAFACTGLTLAAQKTVTDPNAEVRQVGSFHGIEVATGIQLILTHDNTEAVVVSASTPEFRDKIITKVEKGILYIRYETKAGSINKKNETKALKAWVSYRSIDKLYATTGASVQIDGTFESGLVDMKANTGASITGRVDIGTLRLDQSTGSKVTLQGRAGSLFLSGSTGSRFTGEEMGTSSSDVRVSTGARVSVNAEKELQVHASTGGSVSYRGNAGIRDLKTSTGGSVSRI